ncbi:glycosyltransferase [Pseudooctadecabacter sp.]|uniref:glycosyltransferase n=1 Tax=Pseudooctadecabacter sp. TaxID=1966338 RepID=UPI0025D3ED17|nr:glycosyltransferase [Pseudooctadecabacter sp.]
MRGPIGYFVHHQGRGHAERCAAVVNALPLDQPVTVFCARTDIFPDFNRPVEMVKLPSLFEATGDEDIEDTTRPPDTVHCAPLGWPGIRRAMATLAGWFASDNPVLMISDVSAEVAQLSRICSVPHVMVLQHGARGDAGHTAAYDGAAGILCAADEALAQTDWPDSMRRKTHFAGGLGVSVTRPDAGARNRARRRLGVPSGARMILVMSGGGGSGFASAPLGVGARAVPDAQWITIGQIARDWHATEPANLRHDGWVDDVASYLAAADVVIASTGNTTCHQILAAERPWLAIPEWRYFDEQVEKARALDRAGAATHQAAFPSSVEHWAVALSRTLQTHDPARQRALVRSDAAQTTADWLVALAARLRPSNPIAIPISSPQKGSDHAERRDVSRPLHTVPQPAHATASGQRSNPRTGAGGASA